MRLCGFGFKANLGLAVRDNKYAFPVCDIVFEKC